MLVSTRGRYALRVVIDLAEHYNGKYIPMKDVAERQQISLKYITKIMPPLTQAGYVEGVHGKGGGYKLKKDPADCKVGDILRLTEGTLAPVSCLEEGAEPCERAAECQTLPMWRELDHRISDYLDSVTIADLMANELPDNYVI